MKLFFLILFIPAYPADKDGASIEQFYELPNEIHELIIKASYDDYKRSMKFGGYKFAYPVLKTLDTLSHVSTYYHETIKELIEKEIEFSEGYLLFLSKAIPFNDKFKTFGHAIQYYLNNPLEYKYPNYSYDSQGSTSFDTFLIPLVALRMIGGKNIDEEIKLLLQKEPKNQNEIIHIKKLNDHAFLLPSYSDETLYIELFKQSSLSTELNGKNFIFKNICFPETMSFSLENHTIFKFDHCVLPKILNLTFQKDIDIMEKCELMDVLYPRDHRNFSIISQNGRIKTFRILEDFWRYSRSGSPLETLEITVDSIHELSLILAPKSIDSNLTISIHTQKEMIDTFNFHGGHTCVTFLPILKIRGISIYSSKNTTINSILNSIECNFLESLEIDLSHLFGNYSSEPFSLDLVRFEKLKKLKINTNSEIDIFNQIDKIILPDNANDFSLSLKNRNIEIQLQKKSMFDALSYVKMYNFSPKILSDITEKINVPKILDFSVRTQDPQEIDFSFFYGLEKIIFDCYKEHCTLILPDGIQEFKCNSSLFPIIKNTDSITSLNIDISQELIDPEAIFKFISQFNVEKLETLIIRWGSLKKDCIEKYMIREEGYIFDFSRFNSLKRLDFQACPCNALICAKNIPDSCKVTYKKELKKLNIFNINPSSFDVALSLGAEYCKDPIILFEEEIEVKKRGSRKKIFCGIIAAVGIGFFYYYYKNRNATKKSI